VADIKTHLSVEKKTLAHIVLVFFLGVVLGERVGDRDEA